MRKAPLVWIVVIAGTLILVLIPAVWCKSTLKDFLPSSAPADFPDTDIIYTGGPGLGFVNSDGSDMATVSLVLAYTDFASTWQSPIITGDGKTIFITYTAAPGYRGKIFAVPTGKKPVDCGWYGTIRVTANGSHILVDTGETIGKYLPTDCGTGNSPEDVYSGVSGALSPDEQYVAEVRDVTQGLRAPKIILRRIATEEERVVGPGDFPIWSRDGKWLAYTGPDGIYIFPGGLNAEPRRLIPLESSQPDHVPVYQEDNYDEYYPPIASWSPDGQWLVYHVYSKNLVAPDAGEWAGHYSIFKVDVNTGEVKKLLDGGYSPFWRWPAEQP